MKRKIFTIVLIAITSISSQLSAQDVTAAGPVKAGYDLKKNVKARMIQTDNGCSIAFEYDVKSSRDVASGLATGRRQYQPLIIKKFFEVNANDNAVMEVKSPRDIASGQATGKRMHQPLTLAKEYDKSSPKLAEAVVKGRSSSDSPPSDIAIDEPGVHKVSIQDFHFTMTCGGKTREITCMDGLCEIPIGDCPNGSCSAIASWSWGLSQSGTTGMGGGSGSGRCAVDFLLEIEDGACTAMAINEKGLPGEKKPKKATTK